MPSNWKRPICSSPVNHETTSTTTGDSAMISAMLMAVVEMPAT